MDTTHDFQPDFYHRLGVDPSVDGKTLQRQYRLLAKIFHPDVSSHADAHERFLRVRQAYDVLSDAEQRDRYDAWLAENVRDVCPLQVRHMVGPAQLRHNVGTQRLYVLLDVQASELDVSQAAPLTLILVLDRSSSMRGERLYRVRKAAQSISERLSDHDTFGIVTFNDRPSVVVSAGASMGPARLRSALETIQAEGGTEVARGLAAGLAEIRRHRHNTRDGVAHVILLTDGRTYGDEARCLALARQAAAANIGLTLFGVGTDWNDELMDEMAEQANGTVRFIDDPTAALEFFDEEVLRLQRIAARQAEVTVEPAAGSRLLAVREVAPGLRTLAGPESRQETFALGNLPIAPPLKLLLEFQVTPNAHNAMLTANVDIRALPVDGEQSVELQRLIVMPVKHVQFEELIYPQPIIEAARRASTLELQSNAWAALDRGDVTRAIESLSFLATRFLELGEEQLATATRRELSQLEQSGSLSPHGNKTIKYGTRRLALPPANEAQ